MQMTFRWYGDKLDSISLKHIKQIPGVAGVVWALHDLPAGDCWPAERIEEVKAQAAAFGFNIDVVESVNVHEDIKLGNANRQKYIENYKTTLANLGKAGVKVVCYNFSAIVDGTRNDPFRPMPDGSTALF
jgi:mannonate dehydratase